MDSAHVAIPICIFRARSIELHGQYSLAERPYLNQLNAMRNCTVPERFRFGPELTVPAHAHAIACSLCSGVRRLVPVPPPTGADGGASEGGPGVVAGMKQSGQLPWSRTLQTSRRTAGHAFIFYHPCDSGHPAPSPIPIGMRTSLRPRPTFWLASNPRCGCT